MAMAIKGLRTFSFEVLSKIDQNFITVQCSEGYANFLIAGCVEMHLHLVINVNDKKSNIEEKIVCLKRSKTFF